jgi:uncharacterized protein (DUF1800 family)
MRASNLSLRLRSAGTAAVISTWVLAAGIAPVEAAGSDSGSTATVSQADATRFLEQSSFGPTSATVAEVQKLGIAGYLTQQFATPATGYKGYVYYPSSPKEGCPAPIAPNCYRDNYTLLPIQMQFFRNALTGSDQLRQRVAFALSQIIVVSGQTVSQPYGMAAYQNLLLNDAFGNFSKLLTDVTLSPVMGTYLNMVNNDWDPRSGENDPNENYAREILQLFSIGLYELNIDGSPKFAGGQSIPTYAQAQVDSFANVFTGWTYPALAGATAKWTDPVNYSGAMPGFPSHHDNGGQEVLLNGYTLPANGNQAKDLSEAIANIFNHPNVGPFIGKQLIQMLVTSNPSPAYVKAVAEAFNDNGKGVRGDLSAVITAILTNSEARSAGVAAGATYGKLREPALMLTSFLRGVGGATQSDGFFLTEESSNMSETIFDSPTVFNFYQPSYPLPDSDLVGPPFGIYDAATAFERYDCAVKLISGPVAPNKTIDFIKPTGTSLDFSAWTKAAASPATLIADINERFFHGAMSTHLDRALTGLMSQIPATDPLGRARAALYVAVTSPEFQVEQ